MPMTQTQFEEYLALYGAQPEHWPQELRSDAAQMMTRLDLASLVRQQEHVDALLRALPIEPPRYGLCERIIANALSQPQHRGFLSWLRDCREMLLPQPVYSLAATLALGLLIGFSAAGHAPGDTIVTMADMFDEEGDYL